MVKCYVKIIYFKKRVKLKERLSLPHMELIPEFLGSKSLLSPLIYSTF